MSSWPVTLHAILSETLDRQEATPLVLGCLLFQRRTGQTFGPGGLGDGTSAINHLQQHYWTCLYSTARCHGRLGFCFHLRALPIQSLYLSNVFSVLHSFHSFCPQSLSAFWYYSYELQVSRAFAPDIDDSGILGCLLLPQLWTDIGVLSS